MVDGPRYTINQEPDDNSPGLTDFLYKIGNSYDCEYNM